MFQKMQKRSVIITVIFGILFLGALAVAAYWLPIVINSMIDVVDHVGNRNEITRAGRVFVITDAYIMLALAAVAVFFLFLLLRIVYRQKVFSVSATRLLSLISWCCFAEGVLAILLFVYFQLVICITLAAFFLGLCLRVVKHVIEEAIRIKNENDYTI